jgi:hypothetical protein
VQILQHQDQGPLGRHRRHGLGELPQHAVRRGAPHLALQRLQGGGAEEGGHLQQPQGRMLPQQRADPRLLRSPTQVPERFEHRQVRFAGAVVFDALPAGQPQPTGRRGLFQKGIHQRGFAHAGLACDKPHTALPALYLRQPAVELAQLRRASQGRRRGAGRAGAAGV